VAETLGRRISSDHPGWLDRARAVLDAGGLVIFPTDTVYGLGCRVEFPDAIERLFEVKGRPVQKAIPVLLGDVAQIERVCNPIPESAYRLVERFWPGALTIVLPRSPELPEALGPLATVGVRMPDHPVALELLRKIGPMAATSANRSGAIETRTAQEAWLALGHEVELTIDGGETPGGVPSTVVDLTKPEHPILREGPIPAEAVHALM
jgi:L-threonylcarbamoyladenylate synthase